MSPINAPDHEFSHRMKVALEGNPRIPEKNKGMFSWVRNELREKHGIEVTLETVRKWYAGTIRPRAKKLEALAEILSADTAWLAHGSTIMQDTLDTARHRASSHGAINVVAGLLQIEGVSIAFPEDENEAQRSHFFGIHQGRHSGVFVSHGQKRAGAYRFEFPSIGEKVKLVFTIIDEEDEFRMFIPAEADIREDANYRGGFYTISAMLKGHEMLMNDKLLLQLAKKASLIFKEPVPQMNNERRDTR